MDEQRERDVVRGLLDGQADAWRACYDEYAELVWRTIARAMGPYSSEVPDVVQETFIAAAKSVQTFHADRGTLGHWLQGIARLQVALHYRREGRHARLRRAMNSLIEADWRIDPGWLQEQADRADSPPEEELETAETATLIRAALTELPPDYEFLLTARYLDDVSVEELARRDETTEVAVRSKLARARRALKEVFLSRGCIGEDTPASEQHAT
ncbi:MAG: sigma-70 family polymerase sigma factor [Planctomycetaceae bacterium]|nr:sigma-70 family polymerase sigma factor [Planctomycetaceae bacterium]